jgi:hypothetical protein
VPRLSERRHRHLARSLVAVCRRAVLVVAEGERNFLASNHGFRGVNLQRPDRLARDLRGGRNLVAGLPWVRALEQAIGAAKAVIVLIGPRGLGNTQQYERVAYG